MPDAAEPVESARAFPPAAPKILVTGMSGTGKSSVLEELARRGHRTVDTDTDTWSRWTTGPDGAPDWVWREEAIAALLDGHTAGALFVAGCKSNQGRFHARFDHVVLLYAPAAVILRRVAERTTNPYGRSPAEQAAVLGYLSTVEPLLRAASTAQIDTAALPLAAVADRLEALAGRSGRSASGGRHPR